MKTQQKESEIIKEQEKDYKRRPTLFSEHPFLNRKTKKGRKTEEVCSQDPLDQHAGLTELRPTCRLTTLTKFLCLWDRGWVVKTKTSDPTPIP